MHCKNQSSENLETYKYIKTVWSHEKQVTSKEQNFASLLHLEEERQKVKTLNTSREMILCQISFVSHLYMKCQSSRAAVGLTQPWKLPLLVYTVHNEKSFSSRQLWDVPLKTRCIPQERHTIELLTTLNKNLKLNWPFFKLKNKRFTSLHSIFSVRGHHFCFAVQLAARNAKWSGPGHSLTASHVYNEGEAASVMAKLPRQSACADRQTQRENVSISGASQSTACLCPGNSAIETAAEEEQFPRRDGTMRSMRDRKALHRSHDVIFFFLLFE